MPDSWTGPNTWTCTVPAALLGKRLDIVLVELMNEHLPERALSRSKIEKLIDEGRVRIDGKQAASRSLKLERPLPVTVRFDAPAASEIISDPDVSFQILYSDDVLCIVDKPAGLVVHPGHGVRSGTLVHGLAALLGESFMQVGHPGRPGIVHRLDKDTSGLMVVAKTERAYQELTKQFLPPRKVHRTYLALTRKPPKGKFAAEGSIDLPLGRDGKNRTRMSVQKEGREAKTLYRVIEEFRSGMLVELQLETGRTHQIRLHLEAIGVPILGDPTYQRGMTVLPAPLGNAVKRLGRQALHAWKLELEHPETKERCAFTCELPKDLAECIEEFRNER